MSGTGQGLPPHASGTVAPVATTGEEHVPAPVPPLDGAEMGEVGEVVVSQVALERRIAELGRQISGDYVGRPPLLVGVLKGAFMFMSDLCRAITLPVEVDFMAVSSYGSATRTSGVVRIVKDLDADLHGRHVLVVEDIVDSGLTLSYLQRYLMARDPASLGVCALLVKEGQQRTDLDLRYVGFHIQPVFVVGYGLDVGERLRNLRAVHAFAGEPEAAAVSRAARPAATRAPTQASGTQGAAESGTRLASAGVTPRP